MAGCRTRLAIFSFKNMFDPSNRIHINYSTDKASDGTVIRSSIMVNIYEQDVENAVKLYQEIREQIELVEKSMGGPAKSKEVMAFPECPDHMRQSYIHVLSVSRA